jgi:hypothetical protein
MNGFDDAKPADDIAFQPIANGNYIVKCCDYKLDQTVTPWRASFGFEITEGDFKGRKVFSNYQVNEKGGPFLKKDMALMGQDEVTSSDLLAKMCLAAQSDNKYEAHIKQREYNGKTYYNIYLNSLANDTDTALDADDSLDSLLNEPEGIDSSEEIAF